MLKPILAGHEFALRRYLIACAALGLAVGVHTAGAPDLKPNSFWLAIVYLAALVIAAWQSYATGILAAVLIRWVIPFTVANGFAAGKLGWLGTSITFLIALSVSRVAERVRASEQRLRDQIHDNTAELEMLYSKLPVGLCFLDKEFRFLRINDRLAAVNGRLPEEHLGRTVDEVLPEAVVQRVKPLLAQVVSTGEPVHDFEFETRSADCAEGWWNIHCAPVTGINGAVTGLQIVVLDVTERYASARALARANEELHRVNDDLSQFAYIAAHDLQEPLRTVVTFSQLVQRQCAGRLDARADQQLTFIVNAGQRMGQLISDVLAYSSMGIDDNRQPEPVPLGPLLAIVCETRYCVEWGDLPTVHGYPRQLQQLFSNLIGNAIKYARPGVPPRVTVTAVPEDQHMWRLTIRDNGQGFKQEYAERIFGIFRRLHGSDVAGSGIGLAICKRVVEHHGGRIWAESTPGEGSAFHFTLPVRNDLQALSRALTPDSIQSPSQ